MQPDILVTLARFHVLLSGAQFVYARQELLQAFLKMSVKLQTHKHLFVTFKL